MARKQTRRAISLNRDDYEAVKQEAALRGITLAALVEMGLAALGVPIVAHPRQSRELAQASAVRRAESIGRRSREEALRRPSRERQLLGDGVANAHGFA